MSDRFGRLRSFTLSEGRPALTLSFASLLAVLALAVDAADPKTLRDFAVKFQDKLKSGIVVLGSDAGEKAMLIAMVSKDLTKRFPAGEIIKAIAPAIGGSGGGRPDMAQAGGPDKDKLPAALEAAYEVVSQKAKG